MAPPDPPLAALQRGIKLRIALGAAATAAYSAAWLALAPGAAPPGAAPPGAADRILLWAKWRAPYAACLFAHVAAVGNARFASPQDISGAGLTRASPGLQLLGALLTNTLEQAALAALASASFAALAPPLFLPLVPAYALLFAAGRALFARGYARGAPARALGFSLTFLPTVVMLAASLFWLALDPW
ncbi:hypothetical protein Rsub_08705 [Raphidocelis subcapitata]|uniref:MAPEG family protein n=1 Tax=Raphidocelis subcapitata TaxID=307507 RepID=A0A2V0PCU1_9CHLO|nr:hypothetical protein Rsub_08705 [Raphidocelis subcapitata]|eukprot:GBF95723.1 hypothetical protein Rsub_08705 [Raphidocelis subcapitata]